jgi:hypothetical protein
VQALHFFLVPETRATVLLDREAKRRRKTGEDPNVYGPNELKAHRFDTKEVLAIMTRPFVMFYSGAYRSTAHDAKSASTDDPNRPACRAHRSLPVPPLRFRASFLASFAHSPVS